MKVEQLIKLIPQKDLEFLSAETSVDFQVKKLRGITVFKLILFSMLNSSKPSLRVMEAFFMSAQFRNFAGIDNLNTKFNSIRDRISNINSDFFEKIFESVFKRYNRYLKEQTAISKVDSTFISVSSKLIDWGMKNGSGPPNLKHIKFTIALKGSLPCSVQIYNTQDFVNENIALADAILKNKFLKESVIVFDRGLQTRKKYHEFSENNILFVGRVKADIVYKEIKRKRVLKPKKNDSVEMIEDIEAHLYIDGKLANTPFRIIKAKIRSSKEMIYLVTNFFDATSYEIAAIYKQRWEIEVFFKFLKQHLNLNHIVSRNENAMKVMIYMTLILAILIIVYKKENKIGSYKIAKLKFEIELDNLMLKEIVKLCGGNPNKAKHLWNSS